MAQQYARDQPAGFANQIKEVAIVGAGGQVGQRLVQGLLSTGKHNITALSRPDSTNKLDPKIKVVNVDYSDEKSLVEALKGKQFLIISMAVTAPPGTEAQLIEAAAKAGVPWVMPNCYGGDTLNDEYAKEGLVTEAVRASTRLVEKLGVSSWVTMNCGFWYEYSLSFSPEAYGFDLKNKKVTFFDEGETRINTSTWKLCGRAIASFLSLPELPQDENDKSATVSQWRNKPLFISSFLMSQRDILDSLNRVMGLKDSDWTIKKESVKERFGEALKRMAAGNDRMAFGTALYARAFYPNGDGDFESKYGLANGPLGLEKEDFDEATKRAIGMIEAGYHPFTNRNVTHETV